MFKNQHIPIVLWVLTISLPVNAQQASDNSTQETAEVRGAVNRAQATRVERGPSVDGEVLSDPIYEGAFVISDFRQNTPDEGQPSSEQTEVRIVYTDDTLYIGVICYVSDPETIIVSDSRRDSSLGDTDSIQIILDTFLDQQNGFVFGTNVAGVEYDGQITSEGRGSGRMGGGGGSGGVRGGGSQQQRGSGQALRPLADRIQAWLETGLRIRLACSTLSSARNTENNSLSEFTS